MNIKYAVVLIFFLFSSAIFKTEKESTSYKSITVAVGDNSYLNILGKTNINKFTCNYYGQFPADTMNVHWQQQKNSIKVNDVQLSLQVASFDCGNKIMNNDLQDLLKQDTYPHVVIELLKLYPTESPGKSNLFGTAELNFQMAGTQQIYKVPVYLKKVGGKEYFVGNHVFDITDFDITPPTKFLGMVKVDNEIAVEFGLDIRIITSSK